MKSVLYLFTALCLLAARGCPSGGPRSAVARLSVESSSVRDLSPSSISSERKADNQVAVAKVIAHAQSSKFQAVVAQSVGVSQDIISAVTLQPRQDGDTPVVDVRARLTDPQLAAKVVNAVARQMAEDFKNNPDVVVRVLIYATSPRPTEHGGGK